MTARPLFTAPTAWYCDPDVAARERTAVFARTWQLFGHASAFEAAGDWRAETLAGYPLVVVRERARSTVSTTCAATAPGR